MNIHSATIIVSFHDFCVTNHMNEYNMLRGLYGGDIIV